MSIIQALIGSISSGGGGGNPPGPPSAYANYGASPTEGYATDITITVENWTGERVYWSVAGMGSPAADPGTDMTGTLSGFWDPGVTSYASTVVTTVNFVSDQETEGTEYWGVYVGSTPGGSEWATNGPWSISDASVAPAGKGYGTVSGSLNWLNNGTYVSYSDASLAPGTGEFAFEALINIRPQSEGGNYVGGGFILGNGDENTWTDPNGLNIFIDSGWLVIVCAGSISPSNIGFGGSYNLTSYIGQWIRLAVVRTTGGYIRTFVNGINQGLFQATGNFTQTQFDFGVQRRLINFASSYNFKGLMTNIHWNTDPGYVNGKFNTGANITDLPTTMITATTGTKLLVNAVSDNSKFVDSSSNNLTPIVTNSGPSFNQKTSYMSPYLWLDADNSESYPGSGNKWFSLGTGDKHATLRNTPTYGIIGSSPAVPAITFDARATPNQYADGGNLGQNNFSTVSIWVYLNGNVWPPTGSQQPSFFTEEFPGTTTKIAFNLGTKTFSLDNTKILGSTFNNAWYEPSGAALTPSTQTWYMLTYTIGDNGDANNPLGKFYVNGTLQGSAVTLPPSITSGGRYRINRRWDNDEIYDASYAVVQMFTQGLTSSQVTDLYNAQKARFGY
jgi:hypothetical protein